MATPFPFKRVRRRFTRSLRDLGEGAWDADDQRLANIGVVTAQAPSIDGVSMRLFFPGSERGPGRARAAVISNASERLQILDQLALLHIRQTELPGAVVVRHDVGERGRAAVVKVGWVLPQCA